jgi:Site-specific recombinases, DNA invertase Pin homologs
MAEKSDAQILFDLLKEGQPKDPRDVDVKTLRYALYARKSTTSEDRQASSIEDQIKDCLEKVITPNELKVVKIYQESFSAKIADMREQFNAMVSEIENGRIDGVIAWHPDRLSRNMKEAGTMIDLVDRGLIKDLKFATFNFENTPAGKMLLGITFVMAKQYSEHLAESVDRGNKRAVEEGEYIGKFMHGYIIDPVTRRFQPDPHNFTKIQQMFRMALDGVSQKDIRLWINKQGYTVQKQVGGEYITHKWSEDNVSILLKRSVYAGVLKYGKTLVNLEEKYDFEPVLSVKDFLKINKIDSLKSGKIVSAHGPRKGETKANLLRQMVICGKCNRPMTSMALPKKDSATNKLVHYRYYYKCETDLDCPMHNKSIRAGKVIENAQRFFGDYLFVTKGNYKGYLERANKEADKKATEFTSNIARLKVIISNKEESYENVKSLILETPTLKEHYDLGKYSVEIKKLKSEYNKAIKARSNIKDAISTYEEYLKLFASIPDILGKIRDMKQMDTLLRFFFSNFTIQPIVEGSFKGSKVTYELKEPYKGFVKNGDFVCGAG